MVSALTSAITVLRNQLGELDSLIERIDTDKTSSADFALETLQRWIVATKRIITSTISEEEGEFFSSSQRRLPGNRDSYVEFSGHAAYYRNRLSALLDDMENHPERFAIMPSPADVQVSVMAQSERASRALATIRGLLSETERIEILNDFDVAGHNYLARWKSRTIHLLRERVSETEAQRFQQSSGNALHLDEELRGYTSFLRSLQDEIQIYGDLFVDRANIPSSSAQGQSAQEASMQEQPTQADPRKVFVVHGRNGAARDAMFTFLRALGLEPMEWEEAVSLTDNGTPYIGDVLDAGFAACHAAVILLTGDDEAQLRPVFQKDHDEDFEKRLTPQPRPNVLFEVGIAFGRYQKRTILVEIGRLRPMSDTIGRHTVRFHTGSASERNTLRNRLETVGCTVSSRGTDWLTTGYFLAANVTSPKLSNSPEAINRIGTELQQELGSRAPKLILAFWESGKSLQQIERRLGTIKGNALPDEAIARTIEERRQQFEKLIDSAASNIHDRDIKGFRQKYRSYLTFYRFHLIKTRARLYGARYPLAFSLENTGTIPAENVSIVLRFPQGSFVVSLEDEDDDYFGLGLEEEPKEPLPEWLQRTQIGSPTFTNFFDSSQFTAPARQSVQRGPLYDEQDRSYVEYEDPRLRHRDPWLLPTLVIYLPLIRAENLDVHYRIHADNLLQRFSG